MKSDLLLILQWWLYIFVIGIIFMPLTKVIFSKLFDKGYLFSKVIGIAISSYIIWLLSSLKIVPFFRISIIISIVIEFVIILLLKGYRGFITFLMENKNKFIIEEILFLAMLIFWSYVRGMQPNIHGLEKFMDFGFVNACLKSKYMPPMDIWYAGEGINYYYFGHYVCAFLTLLTGIDSAITYNLMIATIFSFTFSLAFSIGGNMLFITGNNRPAKVIVAGLISAILLTFGGNLHGAIYAYGVPIAKNMGILKGEYEQYYYPEATRYIGYNPPTNDKTIHEFPIYSFVVSDLHGHVLDIPIVLTYIAIGLVLIAGLWDKNKLIFLIGFLLSISYMTSTWDYIIYLTVTFFILCYVNIDRYKFSLHGVKKILLDMLKVIIISQTMILPYTLKFKSMTSGIGIVHATTPLYQILVLWGYQMFLSVFFVLFMFKAVKKGKRYFLSDVYVLILIISAVGLIIIPEIFYVVDIYGETYHRANTMFKLTYQSFIMFALISGYIIVRILSSINRLHIKRILTALFSITVMLPMLYPYHAIKGYYGSIKPVNYKELDGLKFMEDKYADDYGAIRWLNENVKEQEVIVEADGDSYSDYERISMATGLPTIQGWFVHEWLWRGGYEDPKKRSMEVSLLYESEDNSTIRSILQKYNVSYVVIGEKEREKYKKLNEANILRYGEVAYNSPNTKIIKVK
jgi:uncharacterized membrane protein